MLKRKIECHLLSKNEERRFGESLRRVLVSEYPNPDREDCPNPEIIRDLAFHRKIGNSQTLEQVTTHMFQCSACVRDALKYAEEYKERKRRRHFQTVLAAVVAALMVSFALWTFFHVVPKWRSQSGVTELLSLSKDAFGVEQRPISINRGQLQLEIRFPSGSAEEHCRLRIVDKSRKVLKAAEGTALSDHGITSLKTAFDTSDLLPGDYEISILEPGSAKWAEYPFILK
jgi:hypothetical protein